MELVIAVVCLIVGIGFVKFVQSGEETTRHEAIELLAVVDRRWRAISHWYGQWGASDRIPQDRRRELVTEHGVPIEALPLIAARYSAEERGESMPISDQILMAFDATRGVATDA